MKILKTLAATVLALFVFAAPVMADLDIKFYGEAYPIVADDRRYGGGNERKFGELMFNPSITYKKELLEIHAEGNTNVLDFSSDPNSQNMYYWRCDGVKNAPKFLADIGLIGDRLSARVGAMQFTGLKRLNKNTVHHAFSPTGLEHTTHYDLGMLVGYSDDLFDIRIGCVDGDWQMGQADVFDSDGVSNSSPGGTGEVDIHLGPIDLGGSYMNNRRGSNPGQKTYVNHWLGYIALNTPFDLRGYYGNMERGRTWSDTRIHDWPAEETDIYGVEAAADIGSFMLYCSASKMEHVSGPPQNIWYNNNTTYSEQYTASIGYKDIYVEDLNMSVGATVWNLDGSSDMNIGSDHEWAAYAVITYRFEINNIRLSNLVEYDR